MKTKFFILSVFLVFLQMGFAQTNNRQILHGKVQNDSLTIDNGYVLNINAQTRTTIDKDGLFDIMAKPKDTLLFSGMVFQSKKVILKAVDFQVKIVVITLELANNQLREVVVSKQFKDESLTGNNQRIIDGQYAADLQTTAENQVMPSNQTIKYGMDFVRIFKEVKKVIKPQSENSEKYIEDVAFSEYAQANFSPSFYKNDLQLKEDEIDLFLMYCANDKESRKYLEPDQKFELMDFLINKNKEFKRITLSK
ncbi:hypothetical protein [Flavobacterium agrisoli]|uniref:Carboxypeptidase-like protein n=1 Tax=Flavobacterium agrisoli TaxID=2793066 RepID=A0A934PNY4_9FLAO|nr:hypothetical protein [Flavobacterium agrisoli]MBK0370355.1 hypothetical protein [Flavobacterium agrisoli]